MTDKNSDKQPRPEDGQKGAQHSQSDDRVMTPDELVDEELRESLPASDPHSHTGTSGTPSEEDE